MKKAPGADWIYTAGEKVIVPESQETAGLKPDLRCRDMIAIRDSYHLPYRFP